MPTAIAKRQLKHYREKEPWEKDMDNFDRAQRRRESQWRRHVVRVDAALMSQITDNRRKLNLERLNDLDPETDS
jgi:hypothetical protein